LVNTCIMKSNPDIIQWLLQGDPWVRYNTRTRILLQPMDHPDVTSDHGSLVSSDLVVSIINELKEWPGKIVNSHKSADAAFHKLAFLANIGIKSSDPGIEEIVEKIMLHQSEEGPFTVKMNIPVHFGGTGKDTMAWALCDSPLIVYSLAKFGLQNDERVLHAAQYLKSLITENGYPCRVSKELGKFRGPGKKSDSCPFATLIILKMMLEIPSLMGSPEVSVAADSLLDRWQNSSTEHPYMFYAGTDYRKLKLPYIWYDLLHVVEVLSRVKEVKEDSRLRQMVSLIESKASPDGAFIPESIYKYWSQADFGQKKVPSRWLTLEVYDVLNRFQQTGSPILTDFA
jgi:hypothetical protein